MPDTKAASAVPAGGATAGTQAPAEDQSGFSWRTVINTVLIAYLANFAFQQFMGGKTKQAEPVVSKFEDNAGPAAVVHDYQAIPQTVAPMWSDLTAVDVRVYLLPSLQVPPFGQMTSDSLVLAVDNFTIGNWSESRTIDTEFSVPRQTQQQGSLWAHIFVGKRGHELDPHAPGYDRKDAYHTWRPMTQILAKKKVVRTKKLLGKDGSDVPDDVVAEPAKGPIMAPYYHPNFTLSFVPDTGVLRYPQVPPASQQWITLESTGARDPSGRNGWYFPVLYLNTFWQLRDYMTEINDTVKTLPLHVDLNHLSNWKFNIYANVDENIKANQRNAAHGGTVPGGGDGSEFEDMKRIVIDTNIYLLSTTAIVTLFHTIFEFLAFKNDVSHWRNKKDNVGVSVRTILGNVFMQTVIFLYLVDNSDGTSWMILFGQGLGIVLEAWKITKTVNVRVREGGPDSLLPYKITFEDKHVLSDTEKRTQEYDREAFKYLYMIGVPLLLVYAVYSVVYDTHKGWYSFIITTLVGSVYAYGFLMMVPSLYINYRLQSVAHLPGRAMMYKVLNTFIDDLFAFTIKMPTLHRLATLRDDVIFFVYLYQSYKYKIDFTRINEFGQGGDDEELEEKTANKPLSAPADADVKAAAKASGIEPPKVKQRKPETKPT